MRNLIAPVLVALLGAACTGNPVAPRSPSAPESPPPPLPAPPRAVLSVGRGDLTPPVAVVNFTQMLFDGSRSEGDGLTYLLEYGDGANSTEPVTTRRANAWRVAANAEKVDDRQVNSDGQTWPHRFDNATIFSCICRPRFNDVLAR